MGFFGPLVASNVISRDSDISLATNQHLLFNRKPRPDLDLFLLQTLNSCHRNKLLTHPFTSVKIGSSCSYHLLLINRLCNKAVHEILSALLLQTLSKPGDLGPHGLHYINPHVLFPTKSLSWIFSFPQDTLVYVTATHITPNSSEVRKYFFYLWKRFDAQIDLRMLADRPVALRVGERVNEEWRDFVTDLSTRFGLALISAASLHLVWLHKHSTETAGCLSANWRRTDGAPSDITGAWAYFYASDNRA